MMLTVMLSFMATESSLGLTAEALRAFSTVWTSIPIPTIEMVLEQAKK